MASRRTLLADFDRSLVAPYGLRLTIPTPKTVACGLSPVRTNRENCSSTKTTPVTTSCFRLNCWVRNLTKARLWTLCWNRDRFRLHDVFLAHGSEPNTSRQPSPRHDTALFSHHLRLRARHRRRRATEIAVPDARHGSIKAKRLRGKTAPKVVGILRMP